MRKHSETPNPYFFPRYNRPTPPPPPPGSGTIVIYDDPADQARYEDHRARQLKAFERMRQEEDPDERLHHQRLVAQNRAHNQFYPCVDPPKPDFKTVVESLAWLDQPNSYVPPPRHDPISFYQASHNPAPLNEPQGLPLSFPRLGGIPPPMPTPHMPPDLTQHFQLRARLAENREKYAALLNATECFCAGEWTPRNMESSYNGIYPWGADTPDTIAAAEFAISSLESEEGRSELRLKQVIRANGQVLGICASIYWLTMEASNDKFYEAVVVVSPDQTERVLKYIRPAKYFPEIPAHLHNLLGPNY